MQSHIRSRQAAPSNNTTCTIGGDMIGYPDSSPWGSNPYISIAGDDPTFPAFAECCKPYEAHYLAPCRLWCETGDAGLHDMMACWKKYDFDPYAVDGAQRNHRSQPGLSQGQIAGIAVGGVVLAAAVGGLVWWCCRRKRRSAAATSGAAGGQLEAVPAPAMVASTEPPQYGTMGHGVTDNKDDKNKFRYSTDSSSAAGRV